MRTLGGLVVSIAALALAGCGGGDPGAAREQEPEARSAPALPAFSLEAMLGEVPASAVPDSPFVLRAGDLAAASEVAGVEQARTVDEAPEWIGSLVGTGEDPQVYVPLDLPLAPRAPAPLVADDLGWSIADVDRFISLSDDVRVTTVVGGAVDEETLADLPESGGLATAGEGADLEGSLETASPARPTGIPMRMAADGPWLVAPPLSSVAEDWHSGAPTLADTPGLLAVARLLDDAGAYAAQVEPAQPCALAPQLIDELGLTQDSFAEVDVHAVGWSWREGSPTMTVVHHDADGRAVDETRRIVQERWTGPSFRQPRIDDMVEVIGVEVAADNVVVTLRPAGDYGPEVLATLLEGPDLPFCVR